MLPCHAAVTAVWIQTRGMGWTAPLYQVPQALFLVDQTACSLSTDGANVCNLESCCPVFLLWTCKTLPQITQLFADWSKQLPILFPRVSEPSAAVAHIFVEWAFNRSFSIYSQGTILAHIDAVYTTLKLEDQPVASTNVVSSLGAFMALKATKAFLFFCQLFQLYLEIKYCKLSDGCFPLNACWLCISLMKVFSPHKCCLFPLWIWSYPRLNGQLWDGIGAL